MIRNLLAVLMAFGWQLSVWSAEPAPLLKIRWSELKQAGRLEAGEILAAEGQQPERLRIVHEADEPRMFQLAEIEPPTIAAASYLVRGRIKYSGVEKASHMEMWNHFATGQYFTRTLADGHAPMGKLIGTADWRDLWLPFNKGKEPSPKKLVINLVLAGRGTVELTDLELVSPADALFAGAPGAWWDDRMGGLLGGTYGALIGIWLGTLGTLASLGRARSVGLTSLVIVGVLGVAMLIAGLIAILLGQPYAVYYPLLLCGGLSAGFGWGFIPVFKQRYHQAEMRRMAALDAA